jgi:hypothetical protein
MASKKPAKPIAGQSRDTGKQLAGKAVKYYGSKGAAPFVCSTCSKELIKGIIYEENSSSYCSRVCIPK